MNTENREIFKLRVKEYFGDKSTAFLQTLEDKPTSSFFLNLKKTNRDNILSFIDFPYRQSKYNENCFNYEYESIGKTKAYDLGLIYPQDEESSLPANFVNTDKVKYVIDLCAAPGGKSINILNRLSDDALLISNDISYRRACALSSNLERLGLTNVIVSNNDPSYLANKFQDCFDLVILDAPCSGEGMIRKYPEILDDYSLNNILSLAKTQSELLENAYSLLKKDGQLLYSTCTYALEEDEYQINSFLNKHKDMKIVPINLRDNYSKLDGTVKLCPLNNTEGQFFCLMIKTEGNTNNFNYLKDTHNDYVQKFINDNLNIKNYYLYKKDNNYYLSFCKLIDLSSHILNYGVNLGELKKDRFEPNHSLYRSNLLINKFKYTYDLNEQEYDKYISGLELKTNMKDCYCLITYKGLSLGFGKVSKGTIKNKYPKGLRRML